MKKKKQKHTHYYYIGSSFIRLPNIMWACETHAETKKYWFRVCAICRMPRAMHSTDIYGHMQVLMHLDSPIENRWEMEEKNNHFRLGSDSDDTEKLFG